MSRAFSRFFRKEEKLFALRFGGCAARQSGAGKSRWGRRSRFCFHGILSGMVVEYAKRRKVSFGKASFRPRHSRGQKVVFLPVGLLGYFCVFTPTINREPNFHQTSVGEPLCLDVIAPKRLGFAWDGRKKQKIRKRLLSDLWSGLRGSNPPPRPWQGRALPNELNPQVVLPVGIEPTTRGFSVLCSTN